MGSGFRPGCGTIPKQKRHWVGQDSSSGMNGVIEPRSLALHEPGRQTEEVRGLFDLAERTQCCQRRDARQAKPRTRPPSLGRGNTAGHATVYEKEDGETAGNRQDLEVLNI